MKATTKTTKNADGEYRVRLFIDGKYQAGADYFTDCKQDANRTAKLMVEKAVESDKTTPHAISEAKDYRDELNEDMV